MFGNEKTVGHVAAQISSVLRHLPEPTSQFEIDMGVCTRRSLFQKVASSVLQNDYRVTAMYGCFGLLIPVALLLLQN